MKVGIAAGNTKIINNYNPYKKKKKKKIKYECRVVNKIVFLLHCRVRKFMFILRPPESKKVAFGIESVCVIVTTVCTMVTMWGKIERFITPKATSVFLRNSRQYGLGFLRKTPMEGTSPIGLVSS